MALHHLRSLVQSKRRRGRGHAKGGGKSGRGMKGQKSRAGYHRKAGFEGGQTPLYMRLPKARGSKQKFAPQMQRTESVTVASLNRFPAQSIVGPALLAQSSLVSGHHAKVKLIAKGTLHVKLTVRVHAVSVAAAKQVDAAGGTLERINV